MAPAKAGSNLYLGAYQGHLWSFDDLAGVSCAAIRGGATRLAICSDYIANQRRSGMSAISKLVALLRSAGASPEKRDRIAARYDRVSFVRPASLLIYELIGTDACGRPLYPGGRPAASTKPTGKRTDSGEQGANWWRYGDYVAHTACRHAGEIDSLRQRVNDREAIIPARSPNQTHSPDSHRRRATLACSPLWCSVPVFQRHAVVAV